MTLLDKIGVGFYKAILKDGNIYYLWVQLKKPSLNLGKANMDFPCFTGLILRRVAPQHCSLPHPPDITNVNSKNY